MDNKTLHVFCESGKPGQAKYYFILYLIKFDGQAKYWHSQWKVYCWFIGN